MRKWVVALCLVLAAAVPARSAGAPLEFVSASGSSRGGDRAVDGDPTTTWVGLATPTRPAWIVVKLQPPARSTGVVVTMGRMPANTFMTVEISQDGEHFDLVLSELRHAADGPAAYAFARPLEVGFYRLRFENASRQAAIPFNVQEIAPLLENPDSPASSSATRASLPMRVLGAVWGHHEGKRVLLIVTDPSDEPVYEVRANGHVLKVLAATSTQLLCDFPYPRPVHAEIAVKIDGRIATRKVATVSRAIQWPPPSPPPIHPPEHP